MSAAPPRSRVVLYAPDRARTYDGRTRDEGGVGGGITARLSLVEAFAALGHEVTAYVHCDAPVVHEGVAYVPVDRASAIDCDVLIAISTGGAMTLAPLRQVRVNARLRVLWVQGAPQPADIEAVGADYVVAASNFLRHVCVTKWRVPPDRMFVCYNGIHQKYFRDVQRTLPARDPYGIAFVGPPEKGLNACVRVVRELRKIEPRFHLDVFGGAQLWSQPPTTGIDEPGVTFKGMIGQQRLAAELFGYEYLLALQDIAEGFGMAVQEAKRAGAIAIVSNVGAFGELVRHREDGYLLHGPAESTDVQSAAVDLIHALADDPLRRSRIRRRALATPWDWNLAARTWTEHWQKFFDGGLRSIETIDLADGRHRIADGAYFPASVYDLSPLPDRLGVAEPKQILLAGYFGHGNLGDEALLAVELDEWQRAQPALVAVVASGNPGETSTSHDVRAIDERDIAALEREVRQSVAVVLGGGGLFHDTHGVDESAVMTANHSGIPECATVAALAERTGTPLAIVSAGAGPLTTASGHRLTRQVFDAAGSASVRDRESAALIAQTGTVNTPTVVADLAFLLPSASPESARAVLASLGLAESARVLCVTLRPWDTDAAERDAMVAEALDRLVAERDAAVLFAPFHWTRESHGDDLTAADRVRRRMKHSPATRVLPAGLRPPVVQGVFALCDAVLTMRLHGVILAANAGTPFVALEHAEKIPATLRQLELPDAGLDLATLTADRLVARLTAALQPEARPRFAAAYARTLPALREAAQRSFAIGFQSREIGAGPTFPEKVGPAPISPRGARLPIPRAWRRPLREALQARFLSRAAFAFDHFKRARQRMCGRDVAGVEAPATPGLISIVLPVHNGGAMLREAIDSVLAQSYTDWRLIVVDDGSTDDSAAIARGYAARDPRLQVVQQAWQRLPAALNHGFRHAQGEFLTWVSADNRLRPDALERLADSLRRHPRWDVVYANLDLMDDAGAPLRGSPYFHSYQRPHGSEHISLPVTTDELNTRDNNFIGAGFLYRRRVATLIGDYSSHRFGLEDYDFWMRANALLNVRKADFDEPVVDYRFHGASLTARAETLGLPASRTRLHVFDLFRRDSALWPLVWVVDSRLGAANSLQQRIREAGHVLYDGTYPFDAIAGPWTPTVVVSDNPEFQPPISGQGMLRVLIEDDRSRSSVISPGWDLRLRIGDDMPAHWLKGDRSSLVVPDVNRLFHAIDIRVRSVLSAAVESLAEAPPAATLTASVVICAARAISTLEPVIAAALAQDSPGGFEVVVVNNSPADDALAAVLRRLPSGVRVIPCPIPGHSAARNAGLGAARGAYVCYLDDDAIPADGWLHALCRAFESHPQAGVIGGPILLEPPSPAPAAMTPGWAHFWSHFSPPFAEYREVSNRSEFPWGANWAARRSVLYQIGGFRLAVGRRGNDHRGGEEIVAAELAQRLGHQVAIAPDAAVRHRVDPARFTTSHVRSTQAARHLVAQAVARDDAFDGRGGVPKSVARLLARHIDPHVRAWPHALQDVAYRKAAQWKALRAEVSDLRRRFKRSRRED